MLGRLIVGPKLNPQLFETVMGSGPLVSNAVPQSSNNVNVITYVFGPTHWYVIFPPGTCDAKAEKVKKTINNKEKRIFFMSTKICG